MRLSVQKWIDHHVGLFLFFWIRPVSLLLGVLLRRDHTLRVERHVVVMKLLGGGSLFVALPTLLALRRRYPDKRFTLVCSPAVKPFGELTGVFDDYAVIRNDSVWRLPFSGIRSLLRCFRADCLIDFEVHSKMAGLFSLFTCARNRIGFYMQWNAWKHGVTTHALFYNEISPIYLAYEQILGLLDASRPSHEELREHLVRHNGLETGREGAESDVALAAFSSGLCREREFEPDEWVKILERHLDGGRPQVHLVGGPADREKSESLARALEAAGHPVQNHCGALSLAGSVQVLLDCARLFTIDSGLNHIARRLGVRIDSFWGPTDPEHLMAPIPELDERVHRADIFCSPCVHIIDRPPCLGNNVCMKSHLDAPVEPVNERGWLVHKAFSR